MVAAGLAVDARCPSHVAGHHDQRRLQQAALGQILQQGRECPVEERQQEVFEQVEVVLVRVPVAGTLGLGVDGDEGDAGFDQPPRQQHAGPERVSSVAVAHRRRLLFEVKREAR